MKRECGDCALCCKLMSVPELEKPMNKWCVHSPTHKCCVIYKTRPETCRGYKCMWLAQNQTPKFMKPSRSHVVINPSQDGNGLYIMVDPSHPLAWRAKGVYDYILALGKVVRVYLSCGDDHYWVGVHGPRKMDPDEVISTADIRTFRPRELMA